MNNIFYNIASIIIGLVLCYLGIIEVFKKKKVLFGILSLVHSALFVGFGIFGFFLPEEYEYITILAMLAFALTMILCVLLFNKKDQYPKENKKNQEK